MILLELLLLHRILLYCMYFIGSTLNLFKLTGSTLGTFTVGHCEFVKGHPQPNKLNTIKNNHMKEQELKKDHLLPGQMVSVDHYITRDPGRIYHTKGKSDISDMFSG